MAGLDWLVARPVAHRGLHGNGIVENTLGAAAAAVEGNYGIEVDLQLSADSEVMVFHDTTLDRLTKATGPLAARTAADLKQIEFRDCGERIPTLQDLLALVAGRAPLVLELKSDWNGDDRLAARVAEILAGYDGPVAAMSFDPGLVIALQKYAPGLPRGIVAERYYDDPEWNPLPRRMKFVFGNLLHIPRTRPHFVAYYVKELPALAPLVARHLLGMKLLTWTVRTDADRRRAARWADQMIFEGFRP
ncbi:MAG: glycerophosphodiester phosphodiesterase [Bradyrhizobiaceae bacterium]|nr:glycerophosphodiester phosphodiesterase [Bradyrhizobiaceae bacterium]